MFFPTHHNPLVGAADLDDVERRARGHAESLTLAHGEVVNAAVFAEDFSVCGHQVARGVGQSLALLSEVSVDEALVVATGHEANLLGVGLLRERESMMASEFANLGLGHIAERELRATE